ncbi:hypothetical protein HmCmsJML268_00949 [Escherichia coli]|nr:hypothetical protein HmCmsJML268_00949 [Escherichia coli]
MSEALRLHIFLNPKKSLSLTTRQQKSSNLFLQHLNHTEDQP